jgi:predicted acyltransferase
METLIKPEKKRYLSIDVFRGLTVAVMIFVNTTGEYMGLPAWSHHAKDYGLTYVDLVAPFFIFAIALTYHMFYKSGHVKEGWLQNNLRVIRRYFALVGIGFLGGGIVDMILQKTIHPIYNWGVFQAIGMAGLVTLLFINLPRWWRLAAGILLWVTYQYLLVTFKLDDINFTEEHSGFWGGLGYGIMMLLATVVCEAFETGRMYRFLAGGAVFTAAGIVTSFYWGISKNRLTGPYIFIALGLACFFFYAIWYLYDKLQITQGRSSFFAPIGKNPFFIYVFYGPLTLIPLLFIQFDSPWYQASFFGLLNVFIMWQVAAFLDRKRIYISI